MSANVHPKTAAAGGGASVGVIVVSILTGAGVHLSPELAGAISAVLSTLAAYLMPGPRIAETGASGAEDQPGSPNQEDVASLVEMRRRVVGEPGGEDEF